MHERYLEIKRKKEMSVERILQERLVKEARHGDEG